jgi:hypothetical protein
MPTPTKLWGFWHESGFAVYYDLKKAQEAANGGIVYQVYLEEVK